MRRSYARRIRTGINLARDTILGDLAIRGWALAGDDLVLRAFSAERGRMKGSPHGKARRLRDSSRDRSSSPG